jgi:hypothetical protein
MEAAAVASPAGLKDETGRQSVQETAGIKQNHWAPPMSQNLFEPTDKVGINRRKAILSD